MVMRQENDVRFEAELRPNCSGSLKGSHIFIGFLLVAFIPTGVIFVFIGAWPVFGFMGAELLLLYGALRLSQRRCATVERILLSPSALIVERTNHWGRQKTWSFPPQWLRVEVLNADQRDNHLNLRSHGRSLTIGQFLSPDERLEVASTLERELVQFQRV